MPNCCIPGCRNQKGHKFPRNEKIRQAWVEAVGRQNWTPSERSIVCYDHFMQQDYVVESFFTGLKTQTKVLKKGTIPSVFSKANLGRPRIKKAEASNLQQVVNVEVDVEILDSTFRPSKASQTNLLPRFNLESFVNDDKGINYFTGLRSYEQFKLLLSSLCTETYDFREPDVNQRELSVDNQFFLVLIKLYLNKPDQELCILFEITESCLANLWKTWINFMFFKWKEMEVWPSKELIDMYQHYCFKKGFRNIKVLVEGGRITILKPCKVSQKPQKKVQTIKQEPSDEPVVKKVPKKCPKYIEMSMNLSSFLTAKGQVTCGARVHTGRTVTNTQTQIERHVELMKSYRFLSVILSPCTEFHLQILYVTAMLCNFRANILEKL